MRSPFPLKKGEGMKREAFVFRYAPRKISPLGQSLLLLSSVEMTGRRDPFDFAEKKGSRKSQRSEIFGNIK